MDKTMKYQKQQDQSRMINPDIHVKGPFLKFTYTHKGCKNLAAYDMAYITSMVLNGETLYINQCGLGRSFNVGNPMGRGLIVEWENYMMERNS